MKTLPPSAWTTAMWRKHAEALQRKNDLLQGMVDALLEDSDQRLQAAQQALEDQRQALAALAATPRKPHNHCTACNLSPFNEPALCAVPSRQCPGSTS